MDSPGDPVALLENIQVHHRIPSLHVLRSYDVVGKLPRSVDRIAAKEDARIDVFEEVSIGLRTWASATKP